MRRVLYLIVCLVVALSACDSSHDHSELSSEPEVSAEHSLAQEAHEKWERDQIEAREADKPKLDDSAEFYSWHERDLRNHLEPNIELSEMNDEQIDRELREAADAEQAYDLSLAEFRAKREQDPNAYVKSYELEKAFKGYVTVAVRKPEFVADAKRAYDKFAACEDCKVPAEQAVILVRSCGDNTVVREMATNALRQFRKELLSRLREADYDINTRYTAAYFEAEGKKVDKGLKPNFPLGCAYEVSDFMTMRDLCMTVGTTDEARQWERRVADLYAVGRHCESDTSDPWLAYELYARLGETAHARAMALEVADEIFATYLTGDYNWNYGVLLRNPFLEYDLKFTKEWLAKAGLNEQQADVWLHTKAEAAVKESEEDCREGNSPLHVDSCTLAIGQYRFLEQTDNIARMQAFAPKTKPTKS